MAGPEDLSDGADLQDVMYVDPRIPLRRPMVDIVGYVAEGLGPDITGKTGTNGVFDETDLPGTVVPGVFRDDGHIDYTHYSFTATDIVKADPVPKRQADIFLPSDWLIGGL